MNAKSLKELSIYCQVGAAADAEPIMGFNGTFVSIAGINVAP
jgi:hypothetical protein